jgi:hypothetical protein
MNAHNGAETDVHGSSQGIKMTSIVAAELLPWLKHFSPRTFDRV